VSHDPEVLLADYARLQAKRRPCATSSRPRRDELLADWSLAVKGQPVFPIEPLK
jgi:hypothetical protein